MNRREFAISTLAGALLGLGCAGSERPDTTLPTADLGPALRRLRRRVREHVDDRDRRKQALILVDEAAQTLGRIGPVLAQWREATALLPDEQRHDRARVLAITRVHSEKIGRVVHEAAALAIRLREHVDEAEWALLFPALASDEEACSPR